MGAGDLRVDLRYNFNEQSVSNVAPDTINASQVYDLENQMPNDRALLTFDYSTGGMFSGLRAIQLLRRLDDDGRLVRARPTLPYRTATATTCWSTLKHASLFGERFQFTLGGENVFDTLPDDEQGFVLRLFGVRSAITSPFGMNGAFWYARASVNF